MSGTRNVVNVARKVLLRLLCGLLFRTNPGGRRLRIGLVDPLQVSSLAIRAASSSRDNGVVLVAFGCTGSCLSRIVVIERRTGMLVRRVVFQLVLRDLVLVAVRKVGCEAAHRVDVESQTMLWSA
jgi:hypothetical protein